MEATYTIREAIIELRGIFGEEFLENEYCINITHAVLTDMVEVWQECLDEDDERFKDSNKILSLTSKKGKYTCYA